MVNEYVAAPAAGSTAAERHSSDMPLVTAIWKALGSVVDPEIPVVSIVELGIVRGVARIGNEWVVAVTPTYSGCPATRIIEDDIRAVVTEATGNSVRVVTALAPAWTTDWMAPEARRKLQRYGIAPPHASSEAASAASAARLVTFHRAPASVRCPNCGSSRTSELARFGSTACKAQYRCADCLEPFDYFKPH
jgi:ring-1,2-phenylacetyl-CoA epoxidase subunit PaaD